LVKDIGFSAYLDQHSPPGFHLARSRSKRRIDVMQKRLWVNAMTGQDQLRQRVAFALGEVMVISNHKIDPHGFPPYVRMLHNDAFGTYGTLLKDVTLSPVMGYYLDMGQQRQSRPNNGTLPNENYAARSCNCFRLA